MDREQFAKTMDACEIVVTHGGTGVIISAVKKGKKVIAVLGYRDAKNFLAKEFEEVAEVVINDSISLPVFKV